MKYHINKIYKFGDSRKHRVNTVYDRNCEIKHKQIKKMSKNMLTIKKVGLSKKQNIRKDTKSKKVKKNRQAHYQLS